MLYVSYRRTAHKSRLVRRVTARPSPRPREKTLLSSWQAWRMTQAKIITEKRQHRKAHGGPRCAQRSVARRSVRAPSLDREPAALARNAAHRGSAQTCEDADTHTHTCAAALLRHSGEINERGGCRAPLTTTADDTSSSKVYTHGGRRGLTRSNLT